MSPLVLAAWALLAASTALGAQASLKKLVYVPVWSPQAQFAGYYMALEKGF